MTYVEHIQQRVYANTSLYSMWLPVDRVSVGDYGSIRRGRFNREGNVSQRGIQFKEQVSQSSPSTFGFSDKAKFNARSALGGAAGPSIGAALEIALSGEGAFVYQIRDVTTKRVEDKASFFRDLFLAILEGRFRWREDFVLVDEIREAGSATLIILESDSGKVVIKGGLLTAEESDAPLARGEISAAVEHGSVFHVISQKATTPLFNPRRLVFGRIPVALGRWSAQWSIG